MQAIELKSCDPSQKQAPPAATCPTASDSNEGDPVAPDRNPCFVGMIIEDRLHSVARVHSRAPAPLIATMRGAFDLQAASDARGRRCQQMLHPFAAALRAHLQEDKVTWVRLR